MSMKKTILSRIFGTRRRGKQPQAKRQSPWLRHLRVEPLERRTLLAVTLNGIVTIDYPSGLKGRMPGAVVQFSVVNPKANTVVAAIASATTKADGT